jgi:hypothetical protein
LRHGTLRRRLLPLSLLLAPGCAVSPPYHGVSTEGLWRLTIAGDRITIDYGAHNDLIWPLARYHVENGIRVWEAGGRGSIERVRIEARPGSCIAGAGRHYGDAIRYRRVVDRQWFEQAGCGGPIVAEPATQEPG